MNAQSNDRTATPSPATGEGSPKLATLDTVERLGSWRTNGKYRLGVASRLTGVSSDSIRRWLTMYPAGISKLKAPWKEGMGPEFTNVTKLSFLELIEVLVAGKIWSANRGSYEEVRKIHDALTLELNTHFPFSHQLMSSHQEKLLEGVFDVIQQFDYENGFVSRWCPLGKEGALALDPRRAGGQPAIKGRRLRVVDIRDYFVGGETVESLSRDFDLTPLEVEEALRYALRIAR